MASRMMALAVALIIVAAAGLAALYLFGLAGSEAQRGVKLVIVTRLSPEEQKELRQAFLNTSFAKRYGIGDIEFMKVPYAEWASLAESGRVDGFLIGEKTVYDGLCRGGHLAVFDMKKLIEVVESLDPRYRGEASGGGYCWVAVGQAVYGYIVNKGFLQAHGLPEPETWGSLMNPVYLKPLLENAETVSYPRPSMSGTARTVMHGILQRYGWDRGWELLTVIGMEARIVDSSEKARDQAAEGVVGVAPAYIGYGIEAEKAGRDAVFKIPRHEGILYLSLAAVAKKAPHPKAMEAFILWLLSDEGQKTLARLYYYIPVRPVKGIEWVERIYNEMKGNLFNYNRTLAERVDLAATTYFEAAIADPDSNALLKEIGLRIARLLEEGKISKEEAEKLLAETGKPLQIKDPWTGKSTAFTLEYAEAVNSKLQSSKNRQLFYNAVKDAAVARYHEILQRLSAGG